MPEPVRLPSSVPFRERDVKDAAWTIVKNAKALNDSRHGAAVRWARAYLGLDDRKVVVGSRAFNEEERDDPRVTR